MLSAAWQRHVHDRHRVLKKARYLSLKVTFAGVNISAKILGFWHKGQKARCETLRRAWWLLVMLEHSGGDVGTGGPLAAPPPGMGHVCLQVVGVRLYYLPVL